MHDLLPHYERELAFLRSQADEFARRFPRIASRLSLSGDVLQDPHVERLIQAFALLSSRIHKRLDDDFPLFTESFLDLLYPHYLRPFPSCSIAWFDCGPNVSQMDAAEVLPAGTRLESLRQHGFACTFHTTAPTQLLPVRVCAASFSGAVVAPEGTRLPAQTTALLSIELELTSTLADWSRLGAEHVRLFIDGDPSLVTQLREALTSKVSTTLVQTSPHGPWQADPAARPRAVGLDDDEPLIGLDTRSHPAYRLLTEYFAFPEKFNFIDLPLPAAARHATSRRLGLHFALADLRADSDAARLLELAGARNFVPGCVPVVNLFRQQAKPVEVAHTTATYAVLPDAVVSTHEVYAIDRVFRCCKTPGAAVVREVRPFFSLQHDELLGDGAGSALYWYALRNPSASAGSPGHELELGLVDMGFQPAVPQSETLSIELRVTNRDLPSRMSIGNPGGDLTADVGGRWREIRLLRKPTPSRRFDIGKGTLWRLISHLALNHLSLSAGGLDALKEMLRLYDLRRSPHHERLVAGLVGIECRPAHACVAGNPCATVVRGTEVRLTVDEQHFVGTGLMLFAQVMERFFALYAHINSFTRLRLVSASTGEVLLSCAPRSGHLPLL